MVAGNDVLLSYIYVIVYLHCTSVFVICALLYNCQIIS